MTETETYNGWTNRETWAFWLHVTNDEGWYNSVREHVRGCLTECDGCAGTGKTEPIVAGVVDENGEVDCEGCGGAGEVFEGDPSDWALGDGVVEYVKDALEELLDDQICLCDAYASHKRPGTCPIHATGSNQLRMMRDEIGSWWRIDYTEIGAAARELVSE